MIKIKGYGQKIEYGKNVTSYIPVLKEVEITKIKNRATGKGQCGYYGFVHNYWDVFTDDDPNAEHCRSNGWVHFIKSHQDIKIPAVPMGGEIEV